MRRNEKEIRDEQEIETIIQEARVCRLGFAVDNVAYIVPVNFGYHKKVFYIHCAKEGRKMDMIRKNNQVCIEIDLDDGLYEGGNLACKWTANYRSVIAYGNASIVEEFDQKKSALEIIMKHYAGNQAFQYTDKSIEAVGIIKIEVTQMSGKKSCH